MGGGGGGAARSEDVVKEPELILQQHWVPGAQQVLRAQESSRSPEDTGAGEAAAVGAVQC